MKSSAQFCHCSSAFSYFWRVRVPVAVDVAEAVCEGESVPVFDFEFEEDPVTLVHCVVVTVGDTVC